MLVLLVPANMSIAEADEKEKDRDDRKREKDKKKGISQKIDDLESTMIELSQKLDAIQNTLESSTPVSSQTQVSAPELKISANGDGGGDETYRISIDGPLETIGLFGDCGNDGADFSLVPQKNCVFSVDSIRISDLDEDTSLAIKTICVDIISLKDSEMRNCFDTFTQLVLGLGLPIAWQGEIEASAGASVAAEIAAGISNGILSGISFDAPIIRHQTVPFSQKTVPGSNLALPFGGMILQETGIGSILAEKFVTASYFEPTQSKVTFIGSKPADMILYVGIAEDGDTLCRNLDGVQKNCEELNVLGTNFGNILRVACLVDDGCSGGTLTDDVLKASTLVSISEVNSQTTVQQAAIFDPPSGGGPGIGIDLTQEELDEIAMLVSDNSDELFDSIVQVLGEFVSVTKLLQVIEDTATERAEQNFNLLLKRIENTDFDDHLNQIAGANSDIPNLKQTFLDLDNFLTGLGVTPTGFTAEDLAKRFGDIAAEFQEVDDGIKADINGVIMDINNLVVAPLNNDVIGPVKNWNLNVNVPKLKTITVTTGINCDAKRALSDLCRLDKDDTSIPSNPVNIFDEKPLESILGNLVIPQIPELPP